MDIQLHDPPPRNRFDLSAAFWLLAGVLGLCATAAVAVSDRFGTMSGPGEAMMAIGLGVLTMLAFSPWRYILAGSPERREVRRLARLLRDFDHDNRKAKLSSLQTDRQDEIGELRRALHDALSHARTDGLEVRRLRRTMDDSIRRETTRATGRLLRQAHTDHLTGLGNRRGYEDQLEIFAHDCAQQGRSLTVMLFDIDRFKPVNDKLGHDAGDKVLVALGKLLKGGLRGGDVGFRLGGDEFIVLMPGAPTAAGVRVAERISKLFLQITWPVEDPPRPTLSVGVATARGTDLQNPDEITRRSDTAMYAAKRAGRARVVSHEQLLARGAA